MNGIPLVGSSHRCAAVYSSSLVTARTHHIGIGTESLCCRRQPTCVATTSGSGLTLYRTWSARVTDGTRAFRCACVRARARIPFFFTFWFDMHAGSSLHRTRSNHVTTRSQFSESGEVENRLILPAGGEVGCVNRAGSHFVPCVGDLFHVGLSWLIKLMSDTNWAY